MDWQAQYESNQTPWDEGAPHPALLDFIAESGPFEGRILVPGCGLGHDVRALSTPANQVIGLDIAPAAVAKAQTFPKTGSEEYLVADLFNLPSALHSSFDWIVEHTCFCAIEPGLRPDYVRAAAAALRVDGKIFGIFYLTPHVETGPPFAISKDELTAFFAPHFTILDQWAPTVCFPGRENRELVLILQKR